MVGRAGQLHRGGLAPHADRQVRTKSSLSTRARTRLSLSHTHTLHTPHSTPVNVKKYVAQGKCQHADLYLGLILHRLQSWSRGGISQEMVHEAFRQGAKRSGFASLLFQILDGEVWGKAERNGLYMDQYALLFRETGKHLKLPNMEFAVHNGHDLPVMKKHEVHPMFAYASADAFSEMLLPCPWYVLPAANEVRSHPDWAPLDLEGFEARPTK